MLRRGSQIHCLVVRNLDDRDSAPLVFDTVKGNVDEGVALLQQADVLAGHNIIGYDLALIEELYPDFKCPARLMDTLILARIYFSTMEKQDHAMRPYGLPKKLYGSQGLKAWGIRLGEYKGDFAESHSWDTYTQEMLDYCIQDTTVNLRLFDFLHRRLPEDQKLKALVTA